MFMCMLNFPWLFDVEEILTVHILVYCIWCYVGLMVYLCLCVCVCVSFRLDSKLRLNFFPYPQSHNWWHRDTKTPKHTPTNIDSKRWSLKKSCTHIIIERNYIQHIIIRRWCERCTCLDCFLTEKKILSCSRVAFRD